MTRFLFVFVLVCVWLYFVVEASLTRNPNKLPRYAWVLVTCLLPGVGTALWVLFGRIRRSRSIAPEDDPRFLRSLDDEMWRRRLRDWRNRNRSEDN